MKNVFYVAMFIVSSILIYGCASSLNIPDAEKQPKSISEDENNKISQAVSYHDKGEYDEAISIYQELLNNNPDNILALYEMSFSLNMKEDFQQSLDYALKGLEYDSKYLNDFYSQAGSSLANMGRAKDAVSVYKKGIQKFPNDHMLHYNLAVAYIKLQKLEEAEKSLINTIKANRSHPSSHLMLAGLYFKQGKQIPALLLSCRFLALEPNSARSPLAVSMINELMNWGIEEKDDKNININIYDSGKYDSPYTAMEFMLKLIRASGIMEEIKKKTKVEARVDDISSLISIIGEKNEKYEDFTADYLFPYFKSMNNSKNAEAFVYYIHQSADNEEINTWLSKNKDKVNEFLSWNKNYKWDN